jgi:hypothetical protein
MIATLAGKSGETFMRSVIIIVGGFVLWAVCLGIAKLLAGTHGNASATIATTVFVVLWFLLAAANLWLGVARAGYSFQEELPIFLLIFLLPAAVAVVVKWKFL